jgi:hypothetical protein
MLHPQIRLEAALHPQHQRQPSLLFTFLICILMPGVGGATLPPRTLRPRSRIAPAGLAIFLFSTTKRIHAQVMEKLACFDCKCITFVIEGKEAMRSVTVTD